MERSSKARRGTRRAESLPACLRQFLTPAVWRQARRGLPEPRKGTRWDFHHLVLVVLAMTWSVGDNTPERFEMARGIVALCRPKRRRAGRTAQGFQKALRRLPMRPLVGLAAAVRRRIAVVLRAAWVVDGFVPLGCDGSRLECARNDELLARMGRSNKADAPPSLWVTALVHLTTGVPWAWQLGRGNASERDHLRRLIPTLPAAALVVADAGYVGFELAAALVAADVAFLIRASSQVRLLVGRPADQEHFRDGVVTYWPKEARHKGLPPLRLRLIRVRGRRKAAGAKAGADVWLLTDVTDRARLSADRAGRFYRLRWENEGLFRTYKRTLAKVHLVGRTVRAVHREAYGSLLSCQLLLAQGAWALGEARPAGGAVCSPRKAVLAVRKELIAAMPLDRQQTYRERLERAARERRPRASAKQKRVSPQRTPHKPPKPPKLLRMSEEEKALFQRANATQ